MTTTAVPALTLVPSRPAAPGPATACAAARLVHPDERTGCAWWVVPTPPTGPEVRPHAA